ncbi:MAG: alkyl/aryl-sulfatase [Cyanobacteria bacterium P01_E01_bin.42]
MMKKTLGKNAIVDIFKLCALVAFFCVLNISPIFAAHLTNSDRECQSDIITVTSGVYVSVGNTRANITLIEGDSGAIIVNTGDNLETAKKVLSQFQQVTQKTIQAIIYTHSYDDHIGGTLAFLANDRIPIYARDNFQKGGIIDRKIKAINRARNEMKHGFFLNPEELSSINEMWCKQEITHRVDGFVPPNHRFAQERVSLNIAGITLELVAAPGDSQDELYVWLPDKKVLLCGDNFYSSFPSLYSIRGVSRNIEHWVRTLDKILAEAPEYLIPSRSFPIIESDKIQHILTDYRNSMNFILERTLEGITQGLTIDELIEVVKLPPELVSAPYLHEKDGNIAWTVRGIYSHYLGWFDGNPTHIFPLSALEKATRIVRLAGGKEQLWQAMQTAFSHGDYQWTLQLTDYLMVLEFHTEEVKHLRAKTLRRLAERETNVSAHNYYVSSAKQLEQ